MSEKSNKIHIFWTGGWDSSFRIVQLLMTTNYLVQPHYIIRHEESTGLEINAMIKIMRMISIKYPEVISRFLPTKYVDGLSVIKNKEIEEEFDKLKESGKINEQYRVMLNYCRQFDIKKIEVSLDKTPGQSAQEWLDEHFQGSSIFNCFTYPIFHLTKYDMYKIAKKNNWDDILLHTSFCRRPKVKITPCGTCGPCVDAVYAGMGFRLPLIPRIKAKLQYPLRKFWRNQYKNRNTRLYKFINDKLEKRL